MVYRRPDNVTAASIIIWISALWCGLSALLGLSELDGASQTEVLDKIVMGVAAVAMLVAGVGIPRCENWARWFYLALCGVLFVYDVALLKDQLYMLVPAGVVRAISVVLIFLPNANRYYASGLGKWD